MNEPSDDELMALFRQGQADAFTVLFERHYATAYRYARAILGQSGLSEEVLQEAFLSLARSAERYEGRGQFRAYLLRIVRNGCLNSLSLHVRIDQAPAGQDLGDRPGPQPAPDRLVQAKDQLAMVRSLMAGLPLRQRKARLMEWIAQREQEYSRQSLRKPHGLPTVLRLTKGVA